MIERGGRVVAKVTPDVRSATIYPIVRQYVLPSSIIYTDDYPIYDRLHTLQNSYEHHRIRHSERVYVMGDVHTNTIQGFWSLVKRGIGGVYHQSAASISRPTGRVRLRYNRRDANVPMFVSLLEQVPLKAHSSHFLSKVWKPERVNGSGFFSISVCFFIAFSVTVVAMSGSLRLPAPIPYARDIPPLLPILRRQLCEVKAADYTSHPEARAKR